MGYTMVIHLLRFEGSVLVDLIGLKIEHLQLSSAIQKQVSR